MCWQVVAADLLRATRYINNIIVDKYTGTDGQVEGEKFKLIDSQGNGQNDAYIEMREKIYN